MQVCGLSKDFATGLFVSCILQIIHTESPLHADKNADYKPRLLISAVVVVVSHWFPR